MQDFINSELYPLIENMPDAIIVTDVEGIIVAANHEVKKIFGYMPEELIRKDINILIPERYRDAHKRNIGMYFENPEKRRMAKHRVIMGLKKGGAEFEVDVALAPIKVGDKCYAISSAREVTTRKTEEEDLLEQNKNLEEQNKNLEKLNKELEKYNYTVSHDLKAPLQKIGALTDILLEEVKEGKRSEDLKEISEYIQMSVSSAEKIVTETLDKAKELHKEEKIDIKELIKEINQLVNIPPNLKFNIECIPPFIIGGRKINLLQVLINLLTNSIKYNDKPAGEINCKCEDKGDFYSFTFSDNGAGISKEKLNRIFELFESNSDKSVDSHGVGLATVKSIIESRGGSISVTSKKGEGTTFNFTWPKIIKIEK